MADKRAVIKIEIDGYCLGTIKGDSFFITRPDGEGMEIGAEELKNLLEQYLVDNF